MKIERIELLHLRLPLVHCYETSFGRSYHHETLIVRISSGGAVGWGEVPASAVPLYSYETVNTAWEVIRDFLSRKLRGQEIVGPGPISEVFSFVRGHNMAKAGIEMAILDLFGRAEQKPVWEILGGDRTEIPTGVSLGIEGSVDDLLKKIEESVAKGAKRIKVEIRPRWDFEVLAEIRRRFPDVPLVADANGAYRIGDAARLRRLDEFNLMMVEQPFEHDDLVDHATLQEQLKTPVCLDGSIRSYDDARRAFQVGACRIINVKQARVGGPYNAKMIHNLSKARGAAVTCGELRESGIGRAHNIALASLPGFTLPSDIFATDRYYEDEIVDPPVRVGPLGTIAVPPGPGIGYNVDEKKLAKFCVRREHVLL